MRLSFIPGIATCALLIAKVHAAPPQSSWVNLAADGRLLYTRDALGNRIPDFGDCGYMAGRVPIPEVPVKATVKPGEGDDRAAIQAAIDQVSALPLDAKGIRGAVLLSSGEYQLDAPLKISASGVVLRGAGANDSDKGTRLIATAPRQYTLVEISSKGSPAIEKGGTRKITDKYVPVGSRNFDVDDPQGLVAGQKIMVHRPSTQAWIDALGMDKLEQPWKPGSKDLKMERTVTRIEGQRVFIDAPITTALDAKFGGGTLDRFTWSGRITNSGIEDIKGISLFNAAVKDDEEHGWTFVSISRAEDCWARRIVSEHFGYACVTLGDGGRQLSVMDSTCLDPVSQVTGARRYGFGINGASQCLVMDCHTRNDRHQFVTGAATSGPNAFVNCSSELARNDAGPHHRWASGLLYDGVTVEGNAINIRNRGNMGTGHGWAGANCVVWNCKADSYIIQNPPTAQNWLIGSIGKISGTAGTYDSNGAQVTPASLWSKQREDLQARPKLQVREYVVGDFDEFAADSGASVPIDPAWLSKTAPPGKTGAFDTLEGGRRVPWTHGFKLDPGDSIVSATLSVSVRGMASGAQNGRIFLDDLANSKPLSQYVESIPTTGSTVLRIDLAAELPRLADGKFNLAIENNVAVDWSVLELRVAPSSPGS
ncbi:hypothetical protein [Haloferula sp. BvORR071]|uniref:hypothetical protein n=1 Tax=Haloferula sp. BvORR071 TaxID=1396141 RepID=UPI000695AA0D|nr:hypothetical protein [Haloferula sp. BvORR071]